VLAVAPGTSSVAVGQVFSVTIQVRTIQGVDGAAAYLTFDPARLQVAAVAAGNALPIVMQNQVDNALGRVDFVAGALNAPFPTADFALATVVFTATSPVASTSLAFGAADPRLSDVTFGGLSILGARAPGTVTIQAASLVGRAQPPGRPDAPHERWRIPVTITLQSLGGAPASTALTLDSAGCFTITNQLPGVYRAGVRGLNTLQSTREITMALGGNAVDFGLLRGGDGNGDNAVTLLDFSLLATAFARCTGGSGYDTRADFNGDACVTLLDFSILRANFGSSGDSAAAAPMDSEVNTQVVRLALEREERTLAAGETFTVEVVVASDGSPVDGAAAYLTFDPAVLQALAIENGAALPQLLQNDLDNTGGRIAVAAGALAAVEQQRFVLATLTFRAVGAGVTPLGFVRDGPQPSDVTYAGASVLAGASSSQVVVTALGTAEHSVFLPVLQR
jgi:hypothetical protein